MNTKVSSGIAICTVANVNMAIPLENTKNREFYAVPSPPAIPFAMRALLCTKTVRHPMVMTACAKNFATLSANPNPVVVPVTIKTGTTAGKTEDAPNTDPFRILTDFPLTGASPRFKRTYALRTECERCNSRFKASGQERLWVRNANSAANLNTLAHISALAVALAAVLHSPRHSYRSAKALRRAV